MRLIHVGAFRCGSLILVAALCSTVCMSHILFMYFIVDGQLDYFNLVTIVNNAAMNIHLSIFLCTTQK